VKFTLALHAHSGRWIPPALVFAIWVLLVVSNPGTALDNAANLFFTLLVVAVWWTSAIGNVDDDPHRDLCAAAIGGPARLAAARQWAAVIVLIAAVGVASLLAVASGGRGGDSWPAAIAGTLGLLASGALLGTAVGGFLHRPVLRSPAWTVVIALVAVMTVALAPPVRDVLHDADHARLGGVGVLFLVSVVVAVVAGWAAATLAARMS
jgi:hypothetical protein